MWMCYAESSLPKAVDLESSIERLAGELEILSHDLILEGNRHDAIGDWKWRENRIIEFQKSRDAISKYKEKKMSLEDLMHVLSDQNTKNYMEIKHLPYYIVKKFKLYDPEIESEEKIVENVGEILEYLDRHHSLRHFMKDGVKYFPMYILKTRVSPSDLSIIWNYLSEEKQSELESYLPCYSHRSESGVDWMDSPPPAKRNCHKCGVNK